ncbi:NTF2 fold immunity protein [Massilia pseudoviolaceinigra]|uniref:NTF2 fold immunity protein n=1 Tax=Massilia pseudoviolaceinigra TaxID=3057165 RepID=UPI0027969C39|nr:NTF2 fold immunity protein [Massilia sp. CCM 9206]MDQ1924424.1 NTF2 fold immunity protein [Massilia sp. CCM 9206]
MLDVPAHPRFLDFKDQSFSGDDIAFLLTKPSIRGLTFAGCDIGDEAVRALCALPRLERLWLGASAVTDAVLSDIARVPALNWLVLDHTGITGAGLAAFAGHAALRTLSLRHTRANDACMQHIARIPQLSHVALHGSAVTPEGILALATHPTVRPGIDDAFEPALADAFLREQRRLASRTPPGFVPAAGEERAVLDVLHGFWEAISAWETQLALDHKETPGVEDWREPACSAIFDRFCTPKGRTFGRPNALSFSTPPEYQGQTMLDVEWLSARKVCVYARDRHGKQSRFLLLKKGSAWLLDHKQQLFDGWTRAYL